MLPLFMPVCFGLGFGHVYDDYTPTGHLN
jgi:hypothetical protein